MPCLSSLRASWLAGIVAALGLLVSVACGSAATPTPAPAPSPTPMAASTPESSAATSPAPTAAPTPTSAPTPTMAMQATPTMGHGMHGTPTAMGTPSVQNEFRSDSLVIRNVWARAASQADGVSAVYMVIENAGDQPDRLLHAHCDAAQTVELHETTMEGGVMKMQPVDGIDVPAHGSVELKRGGLHVMLIGLTRDLNPGDELELELHFEHAGHVTVRAIVQKP
ncbi:copper chaperone PCu(A)C [Thermomicrobium sp. 4228-Ro]|uniref:copper chaperone PCu(A)C n=1 Tax=Thermomicrobium sp. 4228-Ro TaxID=2993937 RepID=UPI0022497FDB|nr:copper chaperone PCu(A)C [Thermomicrobium sp. 4228-Ro]MCX2726455.1 copper chaperone PCu(A)C [Thermomicrobium sp. 4228-Ro]